MLRSVSKQSGESAESVETLDLNQQPSVIHVHVYHWVQLR